MNEPKNSLIIGNGFDIDLGLNTRFSDFANAKDFWPENDGSKLSAYLESKKSVEKWFNIEGALREYAMSVSGEFGVGPRTNSEGDAADFAYFEKVRIGLMDYLTAEEKKNIKSESVAAQVLRAIQNNLLFEHIYTLNYTDLNGMVTACLSPCEVTLLSFRNSSPSNSCFIASDSSTFTSGENISGSCGSLMGLNKYV